MAPSQNLINYLSVMCEALVVGAYAVLIGFVTWILKRNWRSMPMTHKVLFGASIFMFFLSIAHLGLLMEQVTVLIVPIPNFQIQIILCAIQFIVCDSILIWRVWVIWGRRYWVTLGPLAIMLVAAGFAFHASTLTEERTFFAVTPTALVVANTSICTTLIAGRIWYMRYKLRRYGVVSAYSENWKGASLVVIESGALYALSQIIALILDSLKNIGLSVLLNLAMPLTGIFPTLIILFVYFKMVPEDETPQLSVSKLKIGPQLSLTTIDVREDCMEISRETGDMISQQLNKSPVYASNAV